MATLVAYALPDQGAKLLAYALPDQGATLEEDGDNMAIGTASDNALQLTDQTVSRYHVELRRHERETPVLAEIPPHQRRAVGNANPWRRR